MSIRIMAIGELAKCSVIPLRFDCREMYYWENQSEVPKYRFKGKVEDTLQDPKEIFFESSPIPPPIV